MISLVVVSCSRRAHWRRARSTTRGPRRRACSDSIIVAYRRSPPPPGRSLAQDLQRRTRYRLGRRAVGVHRRVVSRRTPAAPWV